MRTLIAGMAVVLMATGALAQAPQTSPVPQGRPAAETAEIMPVRPVLRPASPQETATMTATQGSVRVAGLSLSLRPELRPRALIERAMAKQRERQRGAVCGDPDLQGEVVGFVPGQIQGCGIDQAVRVKSVAGVRLSQSAKMDCGTAKALKTWVKRAAVPAFRGKGGGLERLRVAAHYSCRTRNNQPGARISEHGKGRAIDISGFQLRDGRTVTVLDGWRAGGSDARALRSVHKAACGPFGTVLGPESDRFHQNHFHFDTARYRSGPFCR